MATLSINENVQLNSTTLKFATGATVSGFSTDGTFASNSDALVSTEKACKTYIDTIAYNDPDHILYVSTDGNDSNAGHFHAPCLTIAGALGKISDNDSTHRYIISVCPGIYSEDNSEGGIQLKSYVEIRAMDGPIATKITVQDNDNHLFLGIDKASISNIAIAGPTGEGYGSVVMVGAGEMEIENCFFEDCNIGIYCNHASAIFFVKRTKYLGTIDECIRCNKLSDLIKKQNYSRKQQYAPPRKILNKKNKHFMNKR